MARPERPDLALPTEAAVRYLTAYSQRYARRCWRRSPYGYPLDDLQDWALAGLVDAYERFDPSRGRFGTLAFRQIRLGVREGMRQADPLSRTERGRLRVLDRRCYWTGPRSLTPAEREEHALLYGRSGGPVPLTAMLKGYEPDLDDECTIEGRQADDRPGPEPLAVAALEAARLWRLVDQLSTRERTVLRLHYADGLTLKAVARHLGFSESWAWQQERKALAKLREWLAA
jgi:RNA polymerase sigma factor for flagellar operon FliA